MTTLESVHYVVNNREWKLSPAVLGMAFVFLDDAFETFPRSPDLGSDEDGSIDIEWKDGTCETPFAFCLTIWVDEVSWEIFTFKESFRKKHFQLVKKWNEKVLKEFHDDYYYFSETFLTQEHKNL